MTDYDASNNEELVKIRELLESIDSRGRGPGGPDDSPDDNDGPDGGRRRRRRGSPPDDQGNDGNNRLSIKRVINDLSGQIKDITRQASSVLPVVGQLTSIGGIIATLGYGLKAAIDTNKYLDNIYRRSGAQLGETLSNLSKGLDHYNKGLGLSRDEFAKLTADYSRISGVKGSKASESASTSAFVARSIGVDQGVFSAESARLEGLTGKNLSEDIGKAVHKYGLARSEDFLKDVSTYSKKQVEVSAKGSVDQIKAFTELRGYLEAKGGVLGAETGTKVLGNMTDALTSPGGGLAGQLFMRELAGKQGATDPYKAEYIREQGLFYQAKPGGPTTLDVAQDLLSKYSSGDKMKEYAIAKNLGFGTMSQYENFKNLYSSFKTSGEKEKFKQFYDKALKSGQTVDYEAYRNIRDANDSQLIKMRDSEVGSHPELKGLTGESLRDELLKIKGVEKTNYSEFTDAVSKFSTAINKLADNAIPALTKVIDTIGGIAEKAAKIVSDVKDIIDKNSPSDGRSIISDSASAAAIGGGLAGVAMFAGTAGSGGTAGASLLAGARAVVPAAAGVGAGYLVGSSLERYWFGEGTIGDWQRRRSGEGAPTDEAQRKAEIFRQQVKEGKIKPNEVISPPSSPSTSSSTTTTDNKVPEVPKVNNQVNTTAPYSNVTLPFVGNEGISIWKDIKDAGIEMFKSITDLFSSNKGGFSGSGGGGPTMATGSSIQSPSDLAIQSSSSVSNITSTPPSKEIGNKMAYARDFLMKDLGITKEQSSGIVGNLMHESGLNPEASGDHGTARGIAQWRGDRLAKLKAYADKIGKSWTDFNTQLQFISYELKTTESAVLSKIKSSSSIQQAADVVGMYYERPIDYKAGHTGAINNRRNQSQNAYNANSNITPTTDKSNVIPITSANRNTSSLPSTPSDNTNLNVNDPRLRSDSMMNQPVPKIDDKQSSSRSSSGSIGGNINLRITQYDSRGRPISDPISHRIKLRDGKLAGDVTVGDFKSPRFSSMS